MALNRESVPVAPATKAFQEDFTLAAGDGFPLAARLWKPQSSDQPGQVALINAGAGIAFSYYDRFAAFLASAGIPTLLYDYRGIAKSRPNTLVGFSASVQDWGSKDCAAALAWISRCFPQSQKIVIGHSVGGFVTGFAPNGFLIDRMLLVSAHTGYWRDYAPLARIPMYLLWHMLMPVITLFFGYFPGRRLHLLEDLPKQAALDWARRREPEFWWYLKEPDGSPDVAQIEELLQRFQMIKAETIALRVTDDPFATPAATARILGLYANAPARHLMIGPVDVGGQKIGHFGFFRSRFRATLWPRILAWLQQPCTER